MLHEGVAVATCMYMSRADKIKKIDTSLKLHSFIIALSNSSVPHHNTNTNIPHNTTWNADKPANVVTISTAAP